MPEIGNRNKSLSVTLLLVLTAFILPYKSKSQDIASRPVRIYELWDWISYKYSNHPTSLSEGIEYIYIGTSGGIHAFHKYGRYWAEPHTTSNGLNDDFITAVLYDQTTNYLWAAHRNGISYLTPASQRWVNISKANLNLPQSNQIIRLGTDGNAIWIQAEGGYLFTVNKILGYHQAMEAAAPSSVEWQPCTLNSVPDMRNYTLDQNYLIDGRGIILDTDLREYQVTLFDTDINIDVFGGIDGLGLFEGDASIRTLHLRSFGPLQNMINALAIGDNRIWAGGNQIDPNPVFVKAGISVLNPKEQTWNYYENVLINELATSEVNDLAYGNRRLWIGTNQGLSIYDSKKERWKRLSMSSGLSDEVIMSIALEDTVAWIGTPRGLNIVTIPTYKARRVRLSPRQNILKVRKVSVDSQKIWVGTDNGLYSIDKFNRNVEHYDMFGTRIGLDDAVAADFTAIGQGDSMTVFGRYHDLLRYSTRSATWTNIPMSGALREADIFDIAITGNYMWLGTNRGAFLMRLDDYYCENYTTVDGLAGNSVFKIIIDNEWVWFATDRGLTKYAWSKYASFAE